MKSLRSLAASILLAIAVLGFPDAADAHTELRSSTPAKGYAGTSPEKAELVFTKPVSAQATSLLVLDEKGSPAGNAAMTTGGNSATHGWDLPTLGPGKYALRWLSVASDGHRATGDIVFTVSAGSEEPAAPTATEARQDAQPRPLAAEQASVQKAVGPAEVATADPSYPIETSTLPGVIARFGFYVALALVGGILWFRWTEHRDGMTGFVSSTARRIARPAFIALIGFAVARALVGFASVLSVPKPDVAPIVRLLDLYASQPTIVWTLVVMSFVVAFRLLSSTKTDAQNAPAVATLLVAMGAGLASTVGHSEGLIEIVVTSAHLAAAALWIGPMVIFLMARRTSAYAGLDGKARAEQNSDFFDRFSPTARASLFVLAYTGLFMWWTRAGGRSIDNYSALLITKVTLLVVVIGPLAWFHRRRLADLGATAVDRLPIKSLRVETGALVSLLLVAALLSSLTPSVDRLAPTDRAATAGSVSLEVARSAALTTCAALAIGRQDCYQELFLGTLSTDGLTPTMDLVKRTYASSVEFQVECHQLTHSLGREVAKSLTIAKAFAVEASSCAGGYYHGFMEATLSNFDEASMATLVPNVCSDPTLVRYSGTHFNCVHGTGHGLTIRYENDMVKAADGCRFFPESWEQASCAGGVYMQEVIDLISHSATVTGDPAAANAPCRAESDPDFKTECYGTRSSLILLFNDFDYPASFRQCEKEDAAYIGACYRAIGKDASGALALDPVGVKAACDQGDLRWRGECLNAAAANAVFDSQTLKQADALCNLYEGALRTECLSGRDLVADSIRQDGREIV